MVDPTTAHFDCLGIGGSRIVKGNLLVVGGSGGGRTVGGWRELLDAIQ